MAEINKEILTQLSKYPAEIQELAKEALRAADSMPSQGAIEHLSNVVRKIVKDKGAKS
jgi:hypothetical protein